MPFSFRKIFLSFIVLLYCSLSMAQANDTSYFVGKIIIAKNATYDYILRFTINQQNDLTGYSLTDAKGPNETKTKILGTYNKKDNTISFEESSILRSKINLTKNDLCFVKATLKFKKNKLMETLTGKFIGQNSNNVKDCATGEIKLINSNKAKHLLKQKTTDSIPLSKQPGINTEVPQIGPIKLINNTIQQLSFTGNYLKLTLWDNGQVDGDMISIKLNDQFIVEQYTLVASHKIIELTLPDNAVNTITITALNEGTMPPNSASIYVESTTEHYTIDMQAKTNDVRTINLNRKIK